MNTKVTFSLPSDIAEGATSALLLGDFNNWDFNAGNELALLPDGSLSITLSLEAGKTYQYRYLLNNGRWVNDKNATEFVHIPYYQVENCIITVPAKKTPVKKAVASKTIPAKHKVAKATAAKSDEPIKKKITASKADDLTIIEGIGKKIAELLNNASIASFEDLSKASTSKLQLILDEAGNKFKMHNPGTWAKQGKLAAAEKWDELKKLQETLKGGK
jgi:predicted flap endonuclease-1-like 5' DNA nuclease